MRTLCAPRRSILYGHKTPCVACPCGVWERAATCQRLSIRAESIYEVRQIVGQVGLETDSFAGLGMIEIQHSRVQCKPWSIATVCEHWSIHSAAIKMIAAHRLSLFGEVDANLMCSPGFKLAFHQRVFSQCLERPDVSCRRLAIVRSLGAAA